MKKIIKIIISIFLLNYVVFCLKNKNSPIIELDSKLDVNFGKTVILKSKIIKPSSIYENDSKKSKKDKTIVIDGEEEKLKTDEALKIQVNVGKNTLKSKIKDKIDFKNTEEIFLSKKKNDGNNFKNKNIIDDKIFEKSNFEENNIKIPLNKLFINTNKEVIFNMKKYVFNKIETKNFNIKLAEDIISKYFNNNIKKIQYDTISNSLLELSNENVQSLKYYLLLRSLNGDYFSIDILFYMINKLKTFTIEEINYNLFDIFLITGDFDNSSIAFYSAYKIVINENNDKTIFKLENWIFTEKKEKKKRKFRKTKFNNNDKFNWKHEYRSCYNEKLIESLLEFKNFDENRKPLIQKQFDDNKLNNLDCTKKYDDLNSVPINNLYLLLDYETCSYQDKEKEKIEYIPIIEFNLEFKYMYHKDTFKSYNCLAFSYGILTSVYPRDMQLMNINNKESFKNHLLQYLLIYTYWNHEKHDLRNRFEENKMIAIIANKYNNKIFLNGIIDIFIEHYIKNKVNSKNDEQNNNKCYLKILSQLNLEDYFVKNEDECKDKEKDGRIQFYGYEGFFWHTDMFKINKINNQIEKNWISKFGNSYLSTHTKDDLNSAYRLGGYGEVKFFFCDNPKSYGIEKSYINFGIRERITFIFKIGRYKFQIFYDYDDYKAVVINDLLGVIDSNGLLISNNIITYHKKNEIFIKFYNFDLNGCIKEFDFVACTANVYYRTKTQPNNNYNNSKFIIERKIK